MLRNLNTTSAQRRSILTSNQTRPAAYRPPEESEPLGLAHQLLLVLVLLIPVATVLIGASLADKEATDLLIARLHVIWRPILLSALFIIILLVIVHEIADRTIFVKPLHFRSGILETGHADRFLAMKLCERINMVLNTVAKSSAQARSDPLAMKISVPSKVSTEANHLDAKIPGIGISLRWLTYYLKKATGRQIEIIEGEVIQTDDRFTLSFCRMKTGSFTTVTSYEINDLIQRAAEEYIRVTNPAILASYYGNLARSLSQSANFSEASDNFAKAISVMPKGGRYTRFQSELLANWGWTLVMSGPESARGAESKFREAIDVCPHTAYPYVAWGNALSKKCVNETTEKARYFLDAKEKYTKAIETEPDYVYAYASFGTCLRENKESVAAMKMLGKARRLDKEYDYAYIDLGTILLDDGRRSKFAEQAFRRAIQINRRHAQAHVLLGRALAAQCASREDVVAEFRSALELDPSYVYAYVAWGDFLLREAPAAAADKYQKAVEADSKHVRAWSGWGNALAAQGDFAGANAKFQMALKKAPRDDHARVRWAEVLAEQGDLAGAEARFVEASWTHPNYDYLYFAWGKFLLNNQKDPPRAITMFEKTLDINRKHPEAPEWLTKAQASLPPKSAPTGGLEHSHEAAG